MKPYKCFKRYRRHLLGFMILGILIPIYNTVLFVNGFTDLSPGISRFGYMMLLFSAIAYQALNKLEKEVVAENKEPSTD